MGESKELKEIKCVKKLVHFLYRPGPPGAEPTGLVPQLDKAVNNHFTEHKILSNRLFALLLIILAAILGVLFRVWN